MSEIKSDIVHDLWCSLWRSMRPKSLAFSEVKLRAAVNSELPEFWAKFDCALEVLRPSLEWQVLDRKFTLPPDDGDSIAASIPSLSVGWREMMHGGNPAFRALCTFGDERRDGNDERSLALLWASRPVGIDDLLGEVRSRNCTLASPADILRLLKSSPDAAWESEGANGTETIVFVNEKAPAQSLGIRIDGMGHEDFILADLSQSGAVVYACFAVRLPLPQ